MAYTAGDVLARAIMEGSSGLPEDRVVNDFAFQASGAPTSTDITNIVSAVSDFYRATQAVGGTVGQWISNAVNRAATHTIALYHIVSGPMGSPFHEEDWLGPPTATETIGLPTEVAAVLSFHADLTGIPEESGTTRPKARRRGRIYVGPLCTNAVDTGTPPYRLLAPLPVMRAAAVKLMDDSGADGVPWCVWSRADSTLRPVVGGWTDNAPDTQRRRGAAANTRVVWG